MDFPIMHRDFPGRWHIYPEITGTIRSMVSQTGQKGKKGEQSPGIEYPIEFTVPLGVEAVESILNTVIKTSDFKIEPDRWKKDTTRNKNYSLLIKKPDDLDYVKLGMIELIQSKEDQTQVQLSERYNNGESSLSETGNPLVRFFILFTQQLIKEGITIFDTE
jgi:hypothetical protein